MRWGNGGSTTVRRFGLIPVLLVLGGCAANLNDLRATHAGFEVELQEVGNGGGRVCAPLAYAKAEAEHMFSAIEFAQGDALRAQQHMAEARKYLDVAKLASQGCDVTELAPAPDYRVDTTPTRSPFESGDTTDSDGDGITDASDRCPTKPEDRDGFNDDDGCPDTDNDQDGIPDSTDACPLEPEDLDGTEDTDGCVDVDDDGDGIPDVDDICPNAAETVNGLEDTDGCPDEALTRVRMERNQIILVEPIVFEAGTSKMDANTYLVLSELSVLLESQTSSRIRIESHYDNSLDDATAKTLTQQRATVLKEYLSKQGIDAARLEAVGFGSTMPIDTNRTPEGRAANARIEIYIIN